MTEKKANKKRCGAKTRSGEPCKAWAMPNGRCRMHGGKSLKGLAHPGYKTGRYSKYVPSRLLDRYEQAASDPELLNLSEEIALVDSRISELLESVDAGESGRLWRGLSGLRRKFLDAQRAQDQEGMAAALSEILNGIGRGAQDWERWGEIADFLERRRRLVESEQKRRIAMHLVVKVEQAVDAMNQIADAVRDAVLEHVDDGAVRRLVLSDVQSSLDRYLAGSVPRQVDGGD